MSREKAGTVSFVLGYMVSILSLVAFCADKFVKGFWTFCKMLPAAFNLLFTICFFYVMRILINSFDMSTESSRLLESAAKKVVGDDTYDSIIFVAKNVNTVYEKVGNFTDTIVESLDEISATIQGAPETILGEESVGVVKSWF